MNTLHAFVNGNGGISAVVFEVMQSSSGLLSNRKLELVKMMIKNFDDPPTHLYALENNYKVILEPVENKMMNTVFGKLPLFYNQTFYQSELMSLINQGVIKVKLLDTV